MKRLGQALSGSFSRSGGMTLTEILISVTILAILVLATSRIVARNALLTEANRKNTASAALFQMIETRIKGLPFEDVYCFDTANKTPKVGLKIYGNNLMIPWSISKASATLTLLETEVRKRGFDRFRIEMVYMRRDSSDMANNNKLVEDIVPWKDSNDDKKDDLDPLLEFKDCDGNGNYFGVCTSGTRTWPEVPDTKLKSLTVRLYAKGREVAARSFMLTQGGITGAEAVSVESPVKLKIIQPVFSKTFTFNQASFPLRNHLQLVTHRGYPSNWYGYAGKAVRVDNVFDNATLNQTVSGSTPTVNAPGAPGSYLHFIGQTQPGAKVYVYVRPYIGNSLGPIPTNTTLPDDEGTADLNGVVNIQVELDIVSSKLMVGGTPEVWARAFDKGIYSPFVYRQVNIDNQAPVITSATPTGLHLAGGYSPWISAAAVDPAIPSCATCGDVMEDTITALQITRPDGTSVVTWEGAPGAGYQLSEFDTSGSFPPKRHRKRYLFDSWDESLPPTLGPGTYTVRYEVGDTAMYKTSHTWTFTLPDNFNADVSTPILTAPPSFAVGDPGSNVYYGTLLSPYNIKLGTNLDESRMNFHRISMKDLESGIQFKTFRLECCDETLASCHDIMAPYPGGAQPFGTYFYYRNPTSVTNARSPHHIRHYFNTVNAPTHAAGLRRIRVRVKNWAGLEGVLDDWHVLLTP